MSDLHSSIKVSKVISPHSPSATGTISGTVIDTQGFRSTEFIIQAGAQTTTGITVTPVVKSGSATDSLTSESDANLLSTESGAALSGTAGANKAKRIGYKGSNRYVTVDLVVAGAATGLYSAACIQGDPIKSPIAQ